MSKKINQLMMDALVMGMVGNLYEIPERVPLPPTGTAPSDKQKCKPKELHAFVVKGRKIMATSKKDAIKKYNRLKKK